jgi:RNA polymerase sigma factor (sigma-70 family)
LTEDLDDRSAQTFELLQHAQGGDRDAQQRLFLGLSRDLSARVRGHRLTPLLARWQYAPEDIVGEVWRVVFTRGMLDRFEPQGPGSLRRYLSSAVDGVIKDLADKATAEKRGGGANAVPLTPADESMASRVEPSVDGPGPGTEVRGEDLLDRAEALLDEPQRSIWRLRVREELEFAEIGRRLELTEDAARAHFRRARQTVQRSGLLG